MSTNQANYHVAVDQSSPEEWARMLDLFADANLYQTWPYGQVRWGRGALSHLVLYRGPEVMAMAQLRIAPQWSVHCGIAYLRWGPLYVRKQGSADLEVLSAMAMALHEEYVVRRGLFLRILPNSFVDSPRARHLESAFARFNREPIAEGATYRTLVVDLQPSLGDLRKGLDQKWRNQLNRAEKNNLRIVDKADQANFDAFIHLYHEMLARKKFATFSDVEEYGRMQRLLPGGHQLKILVCEEQGVPVSGAVITAMGDTGIYLLGATSDNGMKAKGAYLLQWEILRWLKENGFRYYNLGGINPDTNPGVYHFKAGLSGADLRYTPPYTSCDSRLSHLLVRTAETFRSASRAIKRKKATLLKRSPDGAN